MGHPDLQMMIMVEQKVKLVGSSRMELLMF